MYLPLITLVASSFMLLFVVERIMRIFFEKRRTSIFVMRLTYFLFFAATVIRSILVSQQDILFQFATEIVLNLAGYYFITLNYESSTIKRIAASFITYISLTALSSAMVMVVLLLFPGLSLFGEELAMIAIIIYLPPAYIIAVLMQRFKSMRKSHSFDPYMLVIPAGLLLVFLFLGYFGVSYWYNTEVNDTLYAIAMSFSFIIFSFLTFFMYSKLSSMYENKLELALQTQEREYYFTQSQLMQKSVEQMKAIRHDMKLHLASIRGYSSEIHANTITNYVDSLLGEIKASETYSDTGNIAIDSILNFKLQNAQDDTIKLELNLMVPESLNMDMADISTILGNLLDNALAAVSHAEDKWINVTIEFSRGNLFIQVQNTFDGNVLYTSGMHRKEKTIATRKTGGSHGYGIKNIKKAVEKYNGQTEIKHEGHVFSVAILLYLEQSAAPLIA